MVAVPPQIAPFNVGQEPANWGEQISFICNVLKGDDPIEIHWALNGELITPTSHPEITISRNGNKASFFIIGSVNAHHAGEYACVASNSAGSSTRSTILSVNGILHLKSGLCLLITVFYAIKSFAHFYRI